MSIATTVRRFLDSRNLSYEVLHHPHSSSSAETADLAFIWNDQLAKSVILEDEQGYVMAVLPASHRVDLSKLRRVLHRRLELAGEDELGELFSDCEVGAVPPLGPAYGLPVVYDDHLRNLGGVYFEGGDHEGLIYMGGSEFMSLLADAPHGDIATTA
jgi:Ala-tRNA(Pro) deacylase